jgi:hypothetical protein
MSSISRPDIDPDELIVRAEYFLPIEPGDSNLRKIKDEFRNIFHREGYIQIDDEMDIIGPTHRSMTFKHHLGKPDPPLSWRIKDFLGLTSNGEVPSYQREHMFQKIEERLEDLPFEIELRFRTIDTDETEGYRVTVIVIPTLLQQYRQRILTAESEFDVKTTVKSTKREIERIFSKIEAQPLQTPYTEAEVIESEISQEHRDSLNQLEYGDTALQYLNEGDTCLQRGLLNAALNCYILCIEWTIITHLKREGRRDVIEEEKEEGGDFYWELVEEIEDDEYVSQKTFEKLDNMNSVERRWMAHHKSGELAETDVRNVRDRLEILIRELFPRSDSPN